MPAVRIGEDNELIQQPILFRNEYELQEILAEHPILLCGRGDSALVTISREFPLERGFADIFLIDTNGLPVIVEVKLAGNEESRREVIGQLSDYLSAMARLTLDEANARSAGLLEENLQIMAAVADEADREGQLVLLKSNLASYLRAGQIRGIIVLDSAQDDLIREFSYLNEHSDLDLRLLVVERYRLNRTEYFYHSRFLVSGETDPEMKRQRLRLRLIVEKFSKMKLPVFSTRTTGKENVRVYRDGWPTAVHYEFCDWGDAISIEVQVRHAEYPRLREFLPRLREYLPTVIRNTQRVELVTDDFGWTRLQFFFGEEIDPYWIAQAMVRLCMTENDLSVLLQEGSG